MKWRFALVRGFLTLFAGRCLSLRRDRRRTTKSNVNEVVARWKLDAFYRTGRLFTWRLRSCLSRFRTRCQYRRVLSGWPGIFRTRAGCPSLTLPPPWWSSFPRSWSSPHPGLPRPCRPYPSANLGSWTWSNDTAFPRCSDWRTVKLPPSP